MHQVLYPNPALGSARPQETQLLEEVVAGAVSRAKGTPSARTLWPLTFTLEQ